MVELFGFGPNLSFVSPLAFALLVPVIAALVWRWWRRGQDRATLQFSSTEALRKSARTFRARVAELPTVLIALGLVLTIVALARPQRADTKTKRNVEGIDIIMVLDVSDSMLIEDMNPNRLEASKRIMVDFVKKRQSDRIGLIVFSGESYTRVPLTLDYGILIRSIETVKIDRAVKMGTALGVSLANGVARLRDSTARSRVMIFLTDGENNSGTIDPETALEIAKGYGIKIYTIGAGRDGDAKLPVERTDAFGRKVKTYQPIHSKVNDELLGKMAQETGGKYFRATEEAALRRVFDDIDRLEKSKVDVSEFTKYAELYPGWLNSGVGLMLLGLVLSLTWLRRRP
jgi:Ca-activated chloride channel family protein